MSPLIREGQIESCAPASWEKGKPSGLAEAYVEGAWKRLEGAESWGHQFVNGKELNSANNKNELGGGFPPDAPDEDSALAISGV